MTADLVTLADVCRRLGVKRKTAERWRDRGIFPQPVSLQPLLWEWPTVAAWALETGRVRSISVARDVLAAIQTSRLSCAHH